MAGEKGALFLHPSYFCDYFTLLFSGVGKPGKPAQQN
jgi:hypothetical protein